MSKRSQKKEADIKDLSKAVLRYVNDNYQGKPIENSVRGLAREINVTILKQKSINKLSDAINRLVGQEKITLVRSKSDKKAHTNSKTYEESTYNEPADLAADLFPDQLSGRVGQDSNGRYILIPLAPEYKDESIYIHDPDAKNYLGTIVGARILKSQDFHDAATIIRPIEERGQTALISRLLAMAFDAGIDTTPINTVDYILKDFPRLKIVWDDIQLEKQNKPEDWTQLQKDEWVQKEWNLNLNAWLDSDEKFPPEIVIQLAQTADVEYIPNTKLLFKLLDSLKEYEPMVNKPDLNQRVFDLRDILEELKSIPTKVTENDPNDTHSIANMKKKHPNFMDLRDKDFVTIDPKTCMDMDDAVYVEKLPNGGYIQYTAISLVSEYIKAFGPIFNAALKKCNSKYFADMVAPMLMPILSNIIGSLNAGEDRLAYITKIEYDKNGNVVNSTMGPGVIKSRHKFAYENVDKIFGGDKKERSKHSQGILNSLDALLELENIIRPQREQNGSTKFRTLEPTYRLNSARDAVEQVFDDNSTKAHEAIETSMLSANQEFARFCAEHDIPIMYRVEETIQSKNIEKIRSLLESLNIPFELGDSVESYGELQRAVNQAVEYAYTHEGELFANVVSENIIKCFPKAHYETNNIGHFALNFDAYAHTTSPIRRFSDLVNQMQICAYQAGQPLPFTKEDIQNFAAACNIWEGKSKEFERSSQDLLHAQWIQQKIKSGEDLTQMGVISSVDKCSITVTTKDGKVVIPLAVNEAESSFFLLPNNMSIKNNVTELTYRVGQKLRVRPTHVDLSARMVTAEIAKTQGIKKINHEDPQEELNNFRKTSWPTPKVMSNYTLANAANKNYNYVIHVHCTGSDGSKDVLNEFKWAADKYNTSDKENKSKNKIVLNAISEHNYISLNELHETAVITADDTKYAYFPVDLSFLGEKYKDQTMFSTIVCEFTTRDDKILNIKGNAAKYHFLIVAPQIYRSTTPFDKLWTIKRKNDIDYDLSAISYLYRYKNLPLPEKELLEYRELLSNNGYGSAEFTANDAMTFFDKFPEEIKKLGLKKTVIRKLLNNLPTISRINIPDNILIDAAHASGALVLMAHPGKNLRRVDDFTSAISHLIDLGIDGFNIKEYAKLSKREERMLTREFSLNYELRVGNPPPQNRIEECIKGENYKIHKINQTIKELCYSANAKNRLILDTGGPDCHTIENYENADLGPYTFGNSPVFFEEFESLQQARIAGNLTHRQYEPNLDAVNAFIDNLTARTNGLDYYQAFKEKADETLQMEALKEKFAFARDKTKNEYYTEFLLEGGSLINGNTPQEVMHYLKTRKITLSQKVIDCLKSNKTLPLSVVVQIIEGTFVPPEQKLSEKGQKRRPVTKDATGSHNGGKNGK